MSASHHGDEEELRRQKELMEIFKRQAQKPISRQYPEGRISAEDEGQLAFLVAADPNTNLVRLQFNKPVAWMAMSAKDAVALAEMLIDKAKQVATEPLTVSIG